MAYHDFIPEISPRQTAEGQQFGQFSPTSPTSSFADDPIPYLIETLIASEDAWDELPGLAPLLLREALAEMERVGA